ncbi:hypothetical protein VNI00_012428 [Paramarasmius palmivorus]|uniref:Uncharacterized protein n=1 Tax=Paramarasmius palmivorus TaxID=297713 RepID=A0AAW0C4N4_9AGAR
MTITSHPPATGSPPVRRSPRKATSIQHGPRRQLCQKCDGPARHYRVDCPIYGGNAKRAQRQGAARTRRLDMLAKAAQETERLQVNTTDVENGSLTKPGISQPLPLSVQNTITSHNTSSLHNSSPERDFPSPPATSPVNPFHSDIFGSSPVHQTPIRRRHLEQREGSLAPDSLPDQQVWMSTTSPATPFRAGIFSSPVCATPLGPTSEEQQGHTLFTPLVSSEVPGSGAATINRGTAPDGNPFVAGFLNLPLPFNPAETSTPTSSLATPLQSCPSSPTKTRRKRAPLTLPGQPRIRPCKSNPVYGLVDGAKRGCETWGWVCTGFLTFLILTDLLDVPRKGPKLDTLATWADCNKRFNEKMQAILRLAEEMAEETGCWVYLAAQMPTGRHQYTHYTCRRLRKEAPGPINDINAIAYKMFQGLVNSRRKDVLQTELEIAEARTDVQRLTKENEMLARSQSAAQEVIERLRSRLATSPPTASELELLLTQMTNVVGPNQ